MKRIFLIITLSLFLFACSQQDTPQPDEPKPPKEIPDGCSFYDLDLDENKISGNLIIKRAKDESNIKSYTIYWGISETQKSKEKIIAEIPADRTDKIYSLPDDTLIPEGVTHFLVFSKNKDGESKRCTSCPIDDRYFKKIYTINKGDKDPPKEFIICGNYLFFIASDLTYGAELWQTNGIDTVSIVKDINSGTEDSKIKDIVKYNDNLYFHAYDGKSYSLWKVDSTTLNASKIGNDLNDLFIPTGMTVFNNKIFFSANDNSYDREIWTYNGIDLTLFKDLNSIESSDPSEFTVLNSSTMLFTAYTNEYGFELWKTDGSAANTVMVKDIIEGGIGSKPQNFITCGNKVIFTADFPYFGVEIWSTDGTEGGTFLVKDIREGLFSSNPKNFYYHNNFIYFSANDGVNGQGIWKTNGTEAGTIRIEGSFDPSNFFSYKDTLLFKATNGTNGYELWKVTGSSNSSVMIGDINQTGDSNPSSFCLYNDIVYFTANSSSTVRQIYITEALEFRRLDDVNTVLSGLVPDNIISFNNKLIITVKNGTDKVDIYLYSSKNDWQN